ncbi:H+-ATPase G subunit-domain-containing protein [Lasiosphaeria ovina]|uniref:V-type proton ATPase subunit G n=1 Tax=Lasiosphaeria ovina TaxID=92902 RepID=A0AAE0TYI5_9PEZI|nr:H+-ATPase G subunit-domain-containing protein [Lasiosphaeria ovina]
MLANSSPAYWGVKAEREASKIVQKDRTKRVKESRDEAKKEIDEYRKNKEAEFKAFEAQGNKEAGEEAGRDAEAQIAKIREAGQNSRDKIVNDLLRGVLEV